MHALFPFFRNGLVSNRMYRMQGMHGLLVIISQVVVSYNVTVIVVVIPQSNFLSVINF